MLRNILDLLGSVAFKPVKNDMLGNVKVRVPASSMPFIRPLILL